MPFLYRVPQSGQIVRATPGDVLTVVSNDDDGAQVDFAPAAAPVGLGSMYESTSDANSVDNTAVAGGIMTIIDTADFIEREASPDWAFAPAACVATHIGAGGRYLARVVATINQAAASGTLSEWALAVDLNGDVIGLDFNVVFSGGIQVLDVPAAESDFWTIVECERMVTVANGDTLQPTFGMFNAATVDLLITRLTMTIVPAGAI